MAARKPVWDLHAKYADAAAAGTRCYFAEISRFATLRPNSYSVIYLQALTSSLAYDLCQSVQSGQLSAIIAGADTAPGYIGPRSAFLDRALGVEQYRRRRCRCPELAWPLSCQRCRRPPGR